MPDGRLKGRACAATTLTLEENELPLYIERHPRARRISVRFTHDGEAVRLVLPPRTSLSYGMRFLDDQRSWLTERLSKFPPRIDFVPGARIPILGIEHVIRHAPEARRGVWRDQEVLNVSGRAEHVTRRVQDYLKSAALREIVPRANDKAGRLDRRLGRITLRDTRSRWGSCSRGGNLSFSWRLILSPEPVLDYVVAHEVAHLCELNHGPRFWKLTAELTDAPEQARAWLRENGGMLFRYG